ncbi:Xanthine dehydrogenase 1 [Planktothrix tepida]|uniref:Xanthine dehydrogenase, small subunit n=2 Tax=Planktothrix TaxID=54304 RepID=A0A1J1LH16_9CYAN|nr:MULTISPECIES: xanthine dehydrogenase small subunit [Planktothrix]CAD5929750.1 Xanthine dehydrogenase 1 [Planktothrix tepida]CAD5979816.1 Xanthine dehydrogenase 1 [Planktothrix pseudagardhii]CUR31502.1 Xanthine dehydrogenase, small subunit [Planktothrix tepida PCC 9214]
MQNNTFSLTINGEKVLIQDLSPTLTLLEYLRRSGRVGTKEGCGDGDCGACTVAVVGQGSNGQPQYLAMNSCLIPLAAMAGREIITVEGVGKDGLHPVQAAMVSLGGSQCGYCTPGFIMSLFTAYYKGEVNDESLEGNLCRCTGYLPIRRAAELVNHTHPCDQFSERLTQIDLSVNSVHYITPHQQFFRPLQLSEVLELLQQYPHAKLVAGATDLGLEMSHHYQEFPTLISLESVAELLELKQTSDYVEIGAAIPLSQIEENLKGIYPSLDEMLSWFAARQIRNRATIGGNLATASPIGDLAPVLLSLDAKLRLASLRGERIIAIADFFKGYRQTELQSQEVIVSIIIPKNITANVVHRLSQSYKIGKRGTDDISIVSAAFTIDLDINNTIIHTRLAYGGVAAIPIRAINIETMLIGKPWNYATIQNAKILLKDTFNPLTDLRGSADYRKQLVANLFEKFFIEFSPITLL